MTAKNISGKKKDLAELRVRLRELMPELQQKYGIRSLEIFGSYTRGDQKKGSDLDLLVELDPGREISLFGFISIEQELSDLLGIRVDLVQKSSLKPALRERILQEAVPV